ncbi:hypothetical protein OB2597_12146 [Pseudooceanicola batsensis HTCC2597]|uniref:Uncharacterized protein n=1 Tax=Pseudooceanicola batsensis (strain ATCC BAA-863 / DSM 15984 / KCTC 12145 / HTCC2597) TaxID=252305 RepID=A3TWJ9_PSEBH|nr:hypothetical protein [Pseudooceanicola batsensis]EAQ03995.1 hypothetical protein OB2597_12146 [Pseudooceanicola batsensis HTCC2597]
MTLTLILIVVTLAGIGLFAILVRRAPNRGFFPMLGPGVLLLALAGIGMLRLLPINAAEHPMRVTLALGLLWVGWIGFSAFVAQMLNRNMPGTHPLPIIAGGVATLAPVLGFIAARVVA